MVQQAIALKKLNPKSKQFVYRNLVKALVWFPTVQKALADPAYSGFFIKFRPENGTKTSVHQAPAVACGL